MFKAHNLSIEKCIFYFKGKKESMIMNSVWQFVFSRNDLTAEGFPSSCPLNIVLALPKKPFWTNSFFCSLTKPAICKLVFQGLRLP